MSPRYYDGTLIPASTFGLGTALSPSIYHPPRHLPLGCFERHDRNRLRRRDPYDLRRLYGCIEDEEPEATPRETLDALSDPNIDHNGDLGWTVEYATAYCYKHLIANRPGVVSAIDTARRAEVERKTPSWIFNLLDEALFMNKLKSMVYLKWKSQELHSPGQTRAADKKVKRISIELNSTPFEDDDAHIDELLDVLIHQMIHAYFLVCCGKQKEGSEEDGRLLDGLHFGVILGTIREITKDCRQGKLFLIFYAAQRQGDPGDPFSPFRCAGGMQRRRKDSFIALDAKGSTLGPPPVDGHSHCTHDNRRFRYPAIRNWQVEEYSRCIDLDFASKGPLVWDYDLASGDLKEYNRLHASPSVEYVELVWDKKRVMVPRKKVLDFKSLKKPAMKYDKYELKIPDCEARVFSCLYDFIQRKEYGDDNADDNYSSHNTRHRPVGPPLIIPPRPDSRPKPDTLTTHIRVFKLAHDFYFPELQAYALDRLYNCPETSSDPIAALKELYNAPSPSSSSSSELDGKPPHPDLSTWSREWLKRCPSSSSSEDFGFRNTPSSSSSAPNYLILLRVYGAQLEKLYHALPALKEDVKIAVNALSVGRDLERAGSTLPIPLPVPVSTNGWQMNCGGDARFWQQESWTPPVLPYMATRRDVCDTMYTAPGPGSGSGMLAWEGAWEEQPGRWGGGGRGGVGGRDVGYMRHLYALDGRWGER